MCTYKLSYLARSKPVGVRIYMHIHKNIYMGMGMIDGVSYSDPFILNSIIFSMYLDIDIYGKYGELYRICWVSLIEYIKQTKVTRLLLQRRRARETKKLRNISNLGYFLK